jgi:hypothetical protein
MRKHTKRKHWPKGHLLTPGQRDRLATPPHAAIMAIEMGCGQRCHRDDLGEFINIASICASRMPGASETTRQALAAAVYAVQSVDQRHERTGKWGFSGQEMQTIHRAITLADALLLRANSATVLGAINWLWHNNMIESTDGVMA